MNILVVGGGRVGYYLVKGLLEHGHSPTLLEAVKANCAFLANSLDVPVVCGDGTTVSGLVSAGVRECDALISVTGRDEYNLVSCQLAKALFQVKKTIARVNNPKNAEAMQSMGIDITINSTNTIVSLLEHEVDTANIKRLAAINHGEASINEVVLPPDYRLHGARLSEIRMPNMAVIISISREGRTIIPRGDTQLLTGDPVLLMAKNDALHQVQKLLKLES